jgi:hypothetical protein
MVGIGIVGEGATRTGITLSVERQKERKKRKEKRRKKKEGRRDNVYCELGRYCRRGVLSLSDAKKLYGCEKSGYPSCLSTTIAQLS